MEVRLGLNFGILDGKRETLRWVWIIFFCSFQRCARFFDSFSIKRDTSINSEGGPQNCVLRVRPKSWIRLNGKGNPFAHHIISSSTTEQRAISAKFYYAILDLPGLVWNHPYLTMCKRYLVPSYNLWCLHSEAREVTPTEHHAAAGCFQRLYTGCKNLICILGSPE